MTARKAQHEDNGARRPQRPAGPDVDASFPRQVFDDPETGERFYQEDKDNAAAKAAKDGGYPSRSVTSAKTDTGKAPDSERGQVADQK